ncbi:p53-like transcription factor DNA-binding [Penicillium argentinense]|uniref:P53-like transcription factor DNA-binding n=1 Tax=Penicillium argentinense TaxID=1131581 RepID=A0A9W9G6R9_9EURO|nr:p53-like transcription factor DNA-binding [Penicillium argentinense]KAJ5112402.1 p53-like transcription factor DNA-binding [Penicillium argentinense]
MNPSSLLSESFGMDCPVTTEGDYMNSHVTGFPTDDDDNQRVGGLSSMPVTNGVRYHAQQPAMQDLHYPGSTALAMTPPDSCSDSFSPTSGPLFPHLSQHQHPFDRMAEFRRVPPLQPPAGMSIAMQTPTHAVSSIPGLMGRTNAYSSAYSLHRGLGLPLAGVNEVSRAHQYSSTPRALDGVLDRSHAVFQPPMVESTQRSPNQTEATPFRETTILETVVAEFGGTQQIVKPEVEAKIGKGPFYADGKWTCYRRNYFSVNCSFSLHPWPSTVPLFIRHSDQTLEPIRGFRMCLSAIVNESYNETRPLVQHTPKRDKQSERTPGPVTLQPKPPQSLSTSSAGAGGHPGFSLNSQSLDYNSTFSGAPQPQPPTSHLFERIQFQKATANNGKRRAQQQYYNLVVELYAEVQRGDVADWIPIARRHSEPMVVRGRSPGHYKDGGRRDSTASMGDGKGDGPGGGPPHGMGHAPRSHMLFYENSHRSSLPYGRNDYRQIPKTEHSPLSDSPLVSSSSSSGFDYSMINDTMDPMDTLKTEPSLDPYQDSVFSDLSHHHRHSTGGYDAGYSTYSRYEPIQNPHSLCT